MKVDWRVAFSENVKTELRRIAFALKGKDLPIPTFELERDLASQREAFLNGDQSKVFETSTIASKECLLVLDYYGETDLDGEPTPGTVLIVQVVMFPEEAT